MTRISHENQNDRHYSKTAGRNRLRRIAIVGLAFMTMANSAPPFYHYERELLTGSDLIHETDEWGSDPGCLPPISLKESAMKVSILGSKDNLLASMTCEDNINCIDTADFPTCNGASAEVSCVTDPDALEVSVNSDGSSIADDGDIKKCNDEMTIHIEYVDGSSADATFRQFFESRFYNGCDIFFLE